MQVKPQAHDYRFAQRVLQVALGGPFEFPSEEDEQLYSEERMYAVARDLESLGETYAAEFLRGTLADGPRVYLDSFKTELLERAIKRLEGLRFAS